MLINEGGLKECSRSQTFKRNNLACQLVIEIAATDFY